MTGVDTATERVHSYGAEVAGDAAAHALRRLEKREDVTPAHRVVVAALAARLAARVLPSRAALARVDDPETAVDLLVPEEESP